MLFSASRAAVQHNGEEVQSGQDGVDQLWPLLLPQQQGGPGQEADAEGPQKP